MDTNIIYNMDCLELMNSLPPQSVDAIITDLPYGTTACSWDTIIPFEPMWQGVKRVLKPRGVFVTTASQPFTSKLICSNLDWFKYEWVWDKIQGSNFLNTPFEPMKEHENVIVFSNGSHNYYPQYIPRNEQGTERAKYIINKSNTGKRDYVDGFIDKNPAYFRDPTKRVPSSILRFSRGVSLHPTQKPVALYEYLIRTYTREGDIILDFCCGSGTTGLAARSTNRQYILGDTDAGYCAIAEDRLRMPFEPKAVKADNNVSDLPLFASLETREP